MKASEENPIYTAYVVTKGGKKYELDGVKTDIMVTHGENDLAAQVNIDVANVRTSEGDLLSGQVTVKDRLYLYANSGSGAKEVFRGFIWTKSYISDVEKMITYTCYDHLIYLQESKDSFYFTKGTQTKDAIAEIFNKWGIKFVYEYDSISHPKLNNFRSQRISDIVIELLDEVKKQTGNKYVIYSEKDVVYIKRTGTNTTLYQLKRKVNALSTKSKVTMESMVTQVVITGNKEDDGKDPILATTGGDTGTWGTLQDIINKDKETTLEEAQKEAQEILKEKGQPFEEFTSNAVDIPWIKKGDKVRHFSGDLVGYFIVKSIEHNVTKKTMSLDLERMKE